MIYAIPFKTPQVGQFVMCCLEPPKNWSIYKRDELPMETVGIISLVKKDTVFYNNYKGEFKSFIWKLLPHEATEYIPNKLHNWRDTDPISLAEYNLAKKYRQTIEAFKREINAS